MHNKDSAHELNMNITGNARAYKYSDEPLIRMRNTAITPGKDKLNDMISSIDGDSNVSSITKFINNQFLTRDTRKFRELVRELQPDVNMEFEYENPQTGEKEAKAIPMGVGFFWPSE